MARLPSVARRTAGRSPWGALLLWGPRVARFVAERWSRLDDREKQDFLRLTRKSKGRLGNLTSRERSELTRLMRRMGEGRSAHRFRQP